MKKTNYIIGATALVITIVAVGVYVFRSPRQLPFVSEPIAGASIQFTGYQLDADKDTVLYYETGTAVIIPANAFLTADGKVAQGKVDVKYREYHDAADIFLSGIPMKYDSSGVAGHLESGGMLQFEASQNGNVLMPNPASAITMDFAATNTGNIYYLDTVQRKWVYINQPMATRKYQDPTTDTIGMVEMTDTAVKSPAAAAAAKVDLVQLQAQITTVQKEIKTMEKTEPIKPMEATNGKRQFNLQVKPEEFPEISSLQDVMFEPEGLQKIPDSEYAVVWNDVLLEENVHGKNFKLTLTREDRKLTVLVVPVYSGANYAKAKKEFEKKFASYSNTLKERKDEEARLLAQQQKEKERQEKEMAQQKKQQQHDAEVAQKQRKQQAEKDLAEIRKQDKKDSLDAMKRYAQDSAKAARETANFNAQELADYNRRQKQEQIRRTEMIRQQQRNEDWIAENRPQSNNLWTSFSLLKFGITNIDNPSYSKPASYTIATYVDEQQRPINAYMAFVVMPDRNTVVYVEPNPSNLPLYTGANYTIFIHSQNNELYVLPANKYSAIQNGSAITLQVQQLKNEGNISNAIRKYLNSGVSM